MLARRTALATGAASGIGAALARRQATDGAAVPAVAELLAERGIEVDYVTVSPVDHGKSLSGGPAAALA